MVGDTGDYVKLVAIVKKKVRAVSDCRTRSALAYLVPQPLAPRRRAPPRTLNLVQHAPQKALDVPPSQFIVGSRGGGEDSAEDLDDDTQICSCHVRYCGWGSR